MLKKFVSVLAIASTVLTVNAAQKSKLVDYAQKEMARSMQELKTQALPPYFMSYSISEVHNSNIRASFGKIITNNYSKSRILDVDMRVGDYKFDNKHIIRGNPDFFGSSRGGIVMLPFDDNEQSTRNAIWYATDRFYKAATERYEKAVTNKQVKVAEEDSSADLSHETPERKITDWKRFEIGQGVKSNDEKIAIDTARWAGIIRRISQKFEKVAWLLDGDVYLNTELRNKSIINSEGTELQWPETETRLYVNIKTKADDGMSLPLYKSYFAYTPDGLPSEETIAKDVDAMLVLLEKLRTAPMAETYNGPALLSGEASGVFFHEIFGHRVEGHREKDPNSSQTFKQSIGKKILPDFVDVVFDPTVKNLKGIELAGYYEFDDEGVRGQKVVTVDDGIFKNFLMSRSPIENFEKSNGHGRKQAGRDAVSRQSNLLVEASKTVSQDSIRSLLVDEAKAQGKEYGLYFVKVSGGFTFTSRTIPNAFNVTPLVVYKVYVDGRPDELVRGVDLIGTPLTTFSSIMAAADDLGVFNGVCGAESGGVPVSACSPTLLVKQIEVQKKKKAQAKPPILPAPLEVQAP